MRDMLALGAASGGAYAASPVMDPMSRQYVNQLIANTPLDPAALAYAGEGMDPTWAFITVLTVSMGPRLAGMAHTFVENAQLRQNRRLEAQLGGLVEYPDRDEHQIERAYDD